MIMHVSYNSWYIFFPSSTKQQREMTKFCVIWKRKPNVNHVGTSLNWSNLKESTGLSHKSYQYIPINFLNISETFKFPKTYPDISGKA